MQSRNKKEYIEGLIGKEFMVITLTTWERSFWDIKSISFYSLERELQTLTHAQSLWPPNPSYMCGEIQRTLYNEIHKSKLAFYRSPNYMHLFLRIRITSMNLVVFHQIPSRNLWQTPCLKGMLESNLDL